MSKFAPPFDIIRQNLLDGKVIPFLGSGASMRASHSAWEKCVDADALAGAVAKGERKCYLQNNSCPGSTSPGSPSLPRASELACYLARRASFPTDETLELTKVAQYCNVVAGRDDLEGDLHSIFNKAHTVAPLHELLADVPAPLLIVTTNYDDLIERAFDAKGREYDVVIHTTDPKHAKNILWLPYGETEPQLEVANKFSSIDLSSRTVIYKIHGSIDRTGGANDHYVITEDDYIDFLTRMNKYNVVPAIFSQYFESLRFLFLGYGLRDWNLRVVLNRIKKMSPLRRAVSWAIQHQPSVLETRFWQDRGVEVFDMQIDDFVNNLR